MDPNALTDRWPVECRESPLIAKLLWGLMRQNPVDRISYNEREAESKESKGSKSLSLNSGYFKRRGIGNLLETQFGKWFEPVVSTSTSDWEKIASGTFPTERIPWRPDEKAIAKASMPDEDEKKQTLSEDTWKKMVAEKLSGEEAIKTRESSALWGKEGF